MQWLVLIVSLQLQLVTVDFYISMWQRFFFFFFLALDVFRKEFQQKKTGALLNYVCAVLQQLFCYEILSFICLNY